MRIIGRDKVTEKKVRRKRSDVLAEAPPGTEWRHTGWGSYNLYDISTDEFLGSVYGTNHRTAAGRRKGWARAYCRLVENYYEANWLCSSAIKAYERVNAQVAEARNKG